MLGLISFTTTLLVSGSTFLSPEPGTKSLSNDAVRQTAKRVGFPLYVPDSTPKFYHLRAIETARVGSFGRLGERTVVRFTYSNERDLNSFDLLLVQSNSSTKPEDHMRWVLRQNVFEVSVHSGDTFVSVKKGASDIGFVGGLFSEGSAKTMMDRMVLVRP